MMTETISKNEKFGGLRTTMRKISPLAVTVFCVAICLFLVNFFLFKAGWVTTLKFSKQFVVFQQWKDSWAPMDAALVSLSEQSPDKDLIYSDIFFKKQFKFQYPLTSLLVPCIVSKVTGNYIKVLKFIAWLSVLITVLFVFLTFQHTAGVKTKFDFNSLLVAVSLVIISLLFYPIVKAHSLGQIQAWINAMFSALLYCWIRNWHAPSGILLAAMCLIKPQYGIIVLWGIFRRKWKFVLYFLVFFGAGVFLSVLLFGLNNNLNYFSVLSYLSRHGEAFYPNQSMNGLLNRLLFNAPILDFSRRIFPPFNPVVYYGSLVFACGLLLSALILPKLSKKEGSVWDLSIIALSATMASPIAWEHHYGILLPIYVCVFAYFLKKRNYSYFLVLGVSYCLSSNFIVIINELAYFQGWNILLSYLFIGAGLLLVCLFRLLFEEEKHPV